MAETAVPLATLGVEDPELRPSPRRPVAAAGHERLGPLADDVPPEPDPRSPDQLQAQSRGFGHRGRQTGGQTGWLEGDEERLGPAGEPGQATQPLGDLGRRRAGVRVGRQIEDEDVDRAAGEEHPGDRQTLVERVGRQDDEPVEADAAGDGLDRVERPGEIEPGNDRAVGLGLGHEPQGEGRGTGAWSAAERDAGRAREPARADDRVESREAGPDDPLDASSRLARGRRSELGWVVGRLGRERRRGQGSDHPRSCGTPSRLERRQSGRYVRGEAGHRTLRLERLFHIVNGISQGTKTRKAARTGQISTSGLIGRSPRKTGPSRPPSQAQTSSGAVWQCMNGRTCRCHGASCARYPSRPRLRARHRAPPRRHRAVTRSP